MIGLIDSGMAASLPEAGAILRFAPGPDGAPAPFPVDADRLGHGSALARVIATQAPGIPISCAQVFDGHGGTSAAAVAAGLDWLVSQGARVVNMSLGLVADRRVLREACALAVARDVLLVASVPSVGPQVFPAAYAGVVRVTGDARCHGEEVALLDGSRADFGASPWLGGAPAAHPKVAGSSVAAARVTGMLAAILASHPPTTGERARALLAGAAAHRGAQIIGQAGGAHRQSGTGGHP